MDKIAQPFVPRRGHFVPKDSVEKLCAGRARHLIRLYYVCTF